MIHYDFTVFMLQPFWHQPWCFSLASCTDLQVTMARESWADMSERGVEDSLAFTKSSQLTGNVAGTQMPKGLRLQDMKRSTHEETLDTVESGKHGQNCVAFQPEVNRQSVILVPVRYMPCMVFAQHYETCQSCKARQACEQHCPCRNAQQPCKYHVPCPVGCPKKFQCAHDNCKRGARCKFCHCMKHLQ